MISDHLPEPLRQDVEAINKIPIINSLLEVVCRSTGMGFAAVARVTDNKWVACTVRDEISFGLQPGGELELKTTICNEIRGNNQPVVIDHVSEDEFFCTHHTPAMYGFESYISYPINLKDGRFFGTLCAIDPNPAKLKNPTIMGMFSLFSELISFHLNANDELALSKAMVLEQQKTAELREQFIAILGHDLRNPIGSIMMGTEILLEMPLEEENKMIVNSVRNSAYRASALVNNMMDMTMAKLGDGFSLDKKPVTDLSKTLEHIISEIRSIWPDRTIEADIDLQQTVLCDRERLGQVFSNLLTNAVVHGKASSPVRVKAFVEHRQVKITISNEGTPVEESQLSKIFQPYYRGDDKTGKKGLGLGLYIASEITKAHGGQILVHSSEKETSFTIVFPSGRFDS